LSNPLSRLTRKMLATWMVITSKNYPKGMWID
jgi:hypothetical protein